MIKKLEETWVETLSIVLVLMGFLISILLMSAWISYFVIIVSGFLAGRIFYIKRFTEPIFPFVLMIIGFLFGYILGNFAASRFWTGVFFIISFAASYFLHVKKILVTFKSKSFIK